MSVFREWTCVFPGKMGLSWKNAYPYETYATKEEAEAQAAKKCNVVAVPLQLFEKMKEHERRMVKAEGYVRPAEVAIADLTYYVFKLAESTNSGRDTLSAQTLELIESARKAANRVVAAQQEGTREERNDG